MTEALGGTPREGDLEALVSGATSSWPSALVDGVADGFLLRTPSDGKP